MVLLDTAHIIVDQVAKSLAIQDSWWAKFAAVVAGVAAVATLVLAFFTWQSVRRTSVIIANENANQRLKNTIALNSQFMQSVIPTITEGVALTAAAATSTIMYYSAKPEELRALHETHLSAQAESVAKDYARLWESFTVALNFYVNAFLLLKRGVLDEALFMSSFARTYLATLAAMETIDPVLGGALPSANREAREELKARCEAWLARA